MDNGTDSAKAIEIAKDTLVADMKEKIEAGNKELVERTKEVKFVGNKKVEVDLSDEFNIGDMDLFSDDF